MVRADWSLLFRVAGRVLGSLLLGIAWLFALGAYIEFSTGVALAYVSVVTVAFIGLHLYAGWPSSWISTLRRPSRRAVRGAWLGAAAVMLYTVAEIALMVLQADASESASETAPILMPLLFVVAFPLLEEVVFRGWIQGALRKVAHPAVAIGIAAGLFAVAHGTGSIASRLVTGVFYGSAVYLTGSLWVGIAFHAVGNGTVVIMELVPGLEAWARDASTAPPEWLAPVTIGLFVGAAGMAALWVRNTWGTQGNAAAEIPGVDVTPTVASPRSPKRS